MKSHLLIVGCKNKEAFEQEIIDAISPEFEWLGDWKKCFPAINVRGSGARMKLWLQPLLWTVAGASVPYDIPVRFATPSDSVMSLVVQHYREYYRAAPVADRLASFANSMRGEKQPNRRKKGGA